MKWLEDLVSVVEKGHFARAAEARNITQSAFSRRIKSLEIWAGTELIDRSQHPVSLTPAGRDFLPHAREMIRISYQARGEASEYARIAKTGVTIACLHTLALFQIPSLVAELRRTVGPFEASIIAETRSIEEYLESLINGGSDFFVCYRHEAFPFDIDEADFPRIDIGTDRMLPYVAADSRDIDFESPEGPAIPYLEYAGTSFLSRVVQHTLKSVPCGPRLRGVYRGSLAESLCTAAANGLGLAWLPETVVASNARARSLKRVSEKWQAPMQISAFRAASNNRSVVNKIWAALSGRANEAWPERN
ncbi:MAG: LysR family transcriptional regulator [Pseudomonadota bacterium]